jgi:hypothetical protein
MSMHMIRGVQVHGNSKRRKKAKKLDMKALELEWRQYNKDMRRSNLHSLQYQTLDEYIDYRSGKAPKPKKKEFVPYKSEPTSYVREKKSYPSLSTSPIPDAGTKRESPKYTGDYIIGIATMHKSNLVPVSRGDDPKDYATMRRN